jgi:hypothetical protein
MERGNPFPKYVPLAQQPLNLKLVEDEATLNLKKCENVVSQDDSPNLIRVTMKNSSSKKHHLTTCIQKSYHATTRGPHENKQEHAN